MTNLDDPNLLTKDLWVAFEEWEAKAFKCFQVKSNKSVGEEDDDEEDDNDEDEEEEEEDADKDDDEYEDQEESDSDDFDESEYFESLYEMI